MLGVLVAFITVLYERKIYMSLSQIAFSAIGKKFVPRIDRNLLD